MLSGANGISLQSGRMINSKYRVVQQIGQGGMGTVYEVKGIQDNRNYALKMLHPAFIHVADITTRFLSEIRLGDKLLHNNIVQLCDDGKIDGVPYYVMEMLAGEDLGQRLERGGVMTFGEAYPILTQVIDAVAFAHGEGVVHRDLKPDNIFLCSDGSVKVLDFGIAKITDEADKNSSLTKTMAVLGTPRYMSPEQASGSSKRVDGRADVFSLGAIIYQMLSGEFAFPGDSSNEIIVNIALGRRQTGVLEKVSNLPAGIIQFVDKALADNPAERFQSMREMGDCLRDIEQGVYVEPEPVVRVSAGNVRRDVPSVQMVSLPGCASRIMTETALDVLKRGRRRRAALWVTFGFLAASIGLGAAYCLDEPHTTSVVDRIIRTVFGKKKEKNMQPPPRDFE